MIDFNPPGTLWWNCILYSCGMFSKSSGRNHYQRCQALQVEERLLLTDISEYKRRIVLPFLDQVQEERVILQRVSQLRLSIKVG